MRFEGLHLTDKVAVVIGGTSGLGRAISVGLAEAGADVVPTSRRADHVQATVEEVAETGKRSLAVPCDVSSRASLQNLLQAVLKEFGQVDILVNCAGRTRRTPTLEVSEEEWNQIMDTNLNGVLRACQIFGRHMVERRTGSIINIASIATFVALQEVAAYCASKAGVAALTKSLAIEWASSGVRVNAIAPGVFPTPLNETLLNGTARGQEFLLRTPMKRFGRVEELAGAAIFLASDCASYVTGEILAVDGGFLSSGVNQ